jgi:hypothetical protein
MRGYIKKKSQYVIGSESRIYLPQAIETAQQQPGPNQQHKRDCQLRRHQCAAQAGATGPRA